VVDKDAVFVVLARIGEEQTEELDVTTRPGERDIRSHPNHIATERDHHMHNASVSSNLHMMRGQMNGVEMPVEQRNDGEEPLVAHADLDVV